MNLAVLGFMSSCRNRLLEWQSTSLGQLKVAADIWEMLVTRVLPGLGHPLEKGKVECGCRRNERFLEGFGYTHMTLG